MTAPVQETLEQALADMGKPGCKFDGCDGPSRKRGWCQKHYIRWRKYGDPAFMVGTGNYPHAQKAYAPELLERIRELYYDRNMTLDEVAAEIGQSSSNVCLIMQRYDMPRRTAAKRDQTGPANAMWRGTAVGYTRLHARLHRKRGLPSHCEQCGTTDPSLRYEWANLTGNYDDLEDYARMCLLCHRRYDAARRAKTGQLTRPPRGSQ